MTYPIPNAALDDRLDWLGTSGSGKTYNAGGGVAVISDVDLTQVAFHTRVREKLSAPQVKVFDPILAAYPESLTAADVADASGYSAGSGGFNNLRSSLKTLGLIEYPGNGYVRAADWLFP